MTDKPECPWAKAITERLDMAQAGRATENVKELYEGTMDVITYKPECPKDGDGFTPEWLRSLVEYLGGDPSPIKDDWDFYEVLIRERYERELKTKMEDYFASVESPYAAEAARLMNLYWNSPIEWAQDIIEKNLPEAESGAGYYSRLRCRPGRGLAQLERGKRAITKARAKKTPKPDCPQDVQELDAAWLRRLVMYLGYDPAPIQDDWDLYEFMGYTHYKHWLKKPMEDYFTSVTSPILGEIALQFCKDWGSAKSWAYFILCKNADLLPPGNMNHVCFHLCMLPPRSYDPPYSKSSTP